MGSCVVTGGKRRPAKRNRVPLFRTVFCNVKSTQTNRVTVFRINDRLIFVRSYTLNIAPHLISLGASIYI